MCSRGRLRRGVSLEVIVEEDDNNDVTAPRITHHDTTTGNYYLHSIA